MTRYTTTALRLAIVCLTVTAVGGCFPLMFDRDGNWRGQQPIGPAFGSATQPDAGVPVVTDVEPAAEPAAEAASDDEPAAE